MVGLRAGLWHGDVSAHHRRKLINDPPHILLTTPESLEGMLISQKGLGRERLKHVRTIVVDEIHAFARDDRGIHMLAVFERIQALTGRQLHRIGLSATVGNPEELLQWLVNGSSGSLSVVRAEAQQPTVDIQLDYVGSLQNAALVISRLHQGEKRLVFCDSRRRVEELGVALRALDVEACAADGLADTTSARASSRTPCNAAWTLAESSPSARRRRRSSGLLPRDGGRAGAKPQRNYTWSQRARRRVSARCRCHARAVVTARRGRAAWKRATGGAQWPRRRLAAALSARTVWRAASGSLRLARRRRWTGSGPQP
jgi:hypothetical protein